MRQRFSIWCFNRTRSSSSTGLLHLLILEEMECGHHLLPVVSSLVCPERFERSDGQPEHGEWNTDVTHKYDDLRSRDVTRYRNDETKGTVDVKVLSLVCLLAACHSLGWGHDLVVIWTPSSVEFGWWARHLPVCLTSVIVVCCKRSKVHVRLGPVCIQILYLGWYIQLCRLCRWIAKCIPCRICMDNSRHFKVGSDGSI